MTGHHLGKLANACAILAVTGLAVAGPPNFPPSSEMDAFHLLSVAEARTDETLIVAEEAETPPSLMDDLPYEDIDITTPDRFLLYGKLYDPSQSSDKSGSNASSDNGTITRYPLLILLHGMNGTHQDWGDLPAHLLKKGYAVLAMDIRGHGESAYRETGGRLSWRSFRKDHWLQAGRDVERIIRFFEKNLEDYPQVDTSRVGIIGAKLGANIAIIAGGRDQGQHIKALVVLSPGLNYKGLETSFPIIHYKNPIMVITNTENTYAFESSELLYRWALGAKAIQLYKNIGDSTDMLQNEPLLKERLMDWLTRQFPPTPKKQALSP